MRTALKVQDANTVHNGAHPKSANPLLPEINPVGCQGGFAAGDENQVGDLVVGNPTGNPTCNPAGNIVGVPVVNQEYDAYADDERDSLRAWRARWRQIMQTAIIYFDGIPANQVEKLKGYLTLLGSTTQPFYDQKVTHVISENQHNELATKARDHGCKVYTTQKLSRFLGSLLGKTLTAAVDDGHSNRLAQLLEDDSRMSTAQNRRDDFVSFRGPYLLISDSQGYHRPLVIKEWRAAHDVDDSEWPQLRRAPLGVSPFTAKSALKSDKRRYHEQQQQHKRQAPLAQVVEEESEDEDASAKRFQAETAAPLLKKRRTGDTSDKENQMMDARAMRPIPAQSTNSTRLRDFGEIVASGVPRYSQTSTKSFSARDSVNSREMASLRRKVTGSQVLVTKSAVADASKPHRAQARAKPAKKPGYCENCLERYNDLQEHLTSRTHQQFAANESKFLGLDQVISQLQRPSNLLNRDA